MGLKEDAGKAVYRVAGHKVTAGSKAFIRMILKKNLGWSKERIKMTIGLLDTPFGTAACSCFIALVLAKVPVLNKDPRMIKLREEMNIEGMAVAGEAVVDVGLGFAKPMLADFLSKADQFMPEKKFEAEDGQKFSLNDVQVAKK